jgi:hypothetical protein
MWNTDGTAPLGYIASRGPGHERFRVRRAEGFALAAKNAIGAGDVPADKRVWLNIGGRIIDGKVASGARSPFSGF